MSFKTYINENEDKLTEAKSYVVSNKGVVIRISGFKKGDDSDKIGNEIVKKLGNLTSVKEISIKL